MNFVVRPTVVSVKKEPAQVFPEQPEIAAAQRVVRAYERENGQVPLAFPSKDKEEAEEEQQEHLDESIVAVKGSRKRTYPMETKVFIEQTKGAAFQPIIMDEVDIADDPVQLYENRIKMVGRNPEEVIASIPPLKNIAQNAAALEQEDQYGWCNNLKRHANDIGREIPVIETVFAEYIATFLRPPQKGWERPCKPPFNPETGTLFQCESVLMGGSVLMEFLLPSQQKRMMASPYFQSTSTDKTLDLPPQHRSCFLCSQRITTMLHAHNMSSYHEDEEDKLRDIIIHDYKMPVNVVGGYRQELLLPGFKRWIGIAGPVIGHNRLHYIRKGDGWVQRDSMFF